LLDHLEVPEAHQAKALRLQPRRPPGIPFDLDLGATSPARGRERAATSRLRLSAGPQEPRVLIAEDPQPDPPRQRLARGAGDPRTYRSQADKHVHEEVASSAPVRSSRPASAPPLTSCRARTLASMTRAMSWPDSMTAVISAPA